MNIDEILAGNDFFRPFPASVRQFLSQHARMREARQDEMVFRQGERAETFYLIESGQVDVEVPALYGPVLVIQNLGPGMVLGWSWLIAPFEWDFQAHARSHTTMIEFDGAAVLAQCEQDPKFGYAIFKHFSALMSERLHAARKRMMEQWNPSGFA